MVSAGCVTPMKPENHSPVTPQEHNGLVRQCEPLKSLGVSFGQWRKCHEEKLIHLKSTNLYKREKDRREMEANRQRYLESEAKKREQVAKNKQTQPNSLQGTSAPQQKTLLHPPPAPLQHFPSRLDAVNSSVEDSSLQNAKKRKCDEQSVSELWPSATQQYGNSRLESDAKKQQLTSVGEVQQNRDQELLMAGRIETNMQNQMMLSHPRQRKTADFEVSYGSAQEVPPESIRQLLQGFDPIDSSAYLGTVEEILADAECRTGDQTQSASQLLKSMVAAKYQGQIRYPGITASHLQDMSKQTAVNSFSDWPSGVQRQPAAPTYQNNRIPAHSYPVSCCSSQFPVQTTGSGEIFSGPASVSISLARTHQNDCSSGRLAEVRCHQPPVRPPAPEDSLQLLPGNFDIASQERFTGNGLRHQVPVAQDIPPQGIQRFHMNSFNGLGHRALRPGQLNGQSIPNASATLVSLQDNEMVRTMQQQNFLRDQQLPSYVPGMMSNVAVQQNIAGKGLIPNQIRPTAFQQQNFFAATRSMVPNGVFPTTMQTNVPSTTVPTDPLMMYSGGFQERDLFHRQVSAQPAFPPQQFNPSNCY